MQKSVISRKYSVENIVPYFQPIIDVRNNTVWCYECLARLIDDQARAFLPSEFPKLLELEDHPELLAETMILQCAHYFRHNRGGWNVNLGPADLTDPYVLSCLNNVLNYYPDPSRVNIEISAQTALTQQQPLTQFFDGIAALQCGVFIDNFKPMEDDYEALLALPIRALKLRVSPDIAQPEVKKKWREVVNAANALGVNVTVERVESRDMLRDYQDLGINFVQGFALSSPAPSPSTQLQ